MAIGKSHRIVIEIDPDMKSDIYAALKTRGLTLKEWFIGQALEGLLNNSTGDQADEMHGKK